MRERECGDNSPEKTVIGFQVLKRGIPVASSLTLKLARRQVIELLQPKIGDLDTRPKKQHKFVFWNHVFTANAQMRLPIKKLDHGPS